LYRLLSRIANPLVAGGGDAIVENTDIQEIERGRQKSLTCLGHLKLLIHIHPVSIMPCIPDEFLSESFPCNEDSSEKAVLM